MANVFPTINHKQRSDTGTVLPNVEKSGSKYPAGEFKPADYLPVVRFEAKMEDWIVVMPGKPVALDRLGRVVPAGMKVAMDAASGSTVLTYTSSDYDAKVTDLTTGEEYAVNGTTTYTQTQVTTALRALGLIRATEVARDFFSDAIGYAPYAQFKWCGGDGWNPVNFVQHNYCRQNQVAVGCDYVLEVPLVPATETSETMGDGSISSSAITFGTSQWHDSTALAATTRYASDVTAGDDVVAYVFGKTPVAKQVVNQTAFTCTALDGKTEVNSIAAVTGSSYYFVDYEAGVMFVYEADGDAVPSPFVDGTTTITYFTYEDAATGSANLTVALGDLRPGDFVTMDANGNYIRTHVDVGTAPGGADGHYAADPDYDTAADADISAQLEATIEEAVFRTLGQVIAVEDGPRSGLDRVKTQYTQLTATERMPGSATQGMSYALNLAGGANKMVLINFLAR